MENIHMIEHYLPQEVKSTDFPSSLTDSLAPRYVVEPKH